eukprot:SAG22_NODE_6233_length_882_cov_1.444444_1_plen_81_part_00
MFIAPMRLREEQVMVFQHRPQATFLPQKEKTKERMLRGFDVSATSLNVDPASIKQKFEDFADIVSQIASTQGEKELSAFE